MTESATPLRDRAEAGERLAEELRRYPGGSVVVLGLPRGGVPIAGIIADRLGAALDVLVVRKIGAPGNSEYGLGAVAEGGVHYLDPKLLRQLGIASNELEVEIRTRTEEVARLAHRFRGGRLPTVLLHRTVVLVDDGRATGGTMRAAVEAARLRGPDRLVVAVGVASPTAIGSLQHSVDEVVCPVIPRNLYSVGEWYEEFGQVSDGEVMEILHEHWARDPGAT